MTNPHIYSWSTPPLPQKSHIFTLNCNMVIWNPEEFFRNCYVHFNLGFTVINHADRVLKIITGICLKMALKMLNFEEV